MKSVPAIAFRPSVWKNPGPEPAAAAAPGGSGRGVQKLLAAKDAVLVAGRRRILVSGRRRR